MDPEDAPDAAAPFSLLGGSGCGLRSQAQKSETPMRRRRAERDAGFIRNSRRRPRRAHRPRTKNRTLRHRFDAHLPRPPPAALRARPPRIRRRVNHLHWGCLQQNRRHLRLSRQRPRMPRTCLRPPHRLPSPRRSQCPTQSRPRPRLAHRTSNPREEPRLRRLPRHRSWLCFRCRRSHSRASRCPRPRCRSRSLGWRPLPSSPDRAGAGGGLDRTSTAPQGPRRRRAGVRFAGCLRCAQNPSHSEHVMCQRKMA